MLSLGTNTSNYSQYYDNPEFSDEHSVSSSEENVHVATKKVSFTSRKSPKNSNKSKY